MKPIATDSSLFRYSFTFFSDKKKHLRNLSTKKNRFRDFSRSGGGVYLDFSRQQIDDKAFELLIDLARSNKVHKRFVDMTNGSIENKTENRKVLHTLSRGIGNDDNLKDEISRVSNEIKDFSKKIHDGELRGSSGKKFTGICVVGIGGSNLGTEFVLKSLRNQSKLMDFSFIATCDPCEFLDHKDKFSPESTLFIIISKSYTTREVLMNEALIKQYLSSLDLDYKKHIVRVTAKGSPGDKNEPEITSFHMFDEIGGRYSVSSAVGGLAISLVYGFETYKDFLSGLNEMDTHVLESEPENNLPLISALTDIWNYVYLNYSALAIIPYSGFLEKLPAHIQQLYMESNGKRVDEKGDINLDPSSMIVFGETGTKSQHSFFQLFHQGRVVPVEFIGVLNPPAKNLPLFDNISGHDELWANLLAQADSLAHGSQTSFSAKDCPGNRPSTIITIENIDAVNIGRIISFYEARTVFAGFLWGINPFDQFGVELGKKLATQKRNLISESVLQNKHLDSNNDSCNFYLKSIVQRKITD